MHFLTLYIATFVHECHSFPSVFRRTLFTSQNMRNENSLSKLNAMKDKGKLKYDNYVNKTKWEV